MASPKNQPNDAPDAEPQADDQNVTTTDGTQVPAQENDPAQSAVARDAEAQAAAREQADREAQGAAVQDRDVTPSETVVTTTDNEGNQVTLPTSHTGDQMIVNGPGEHFNEERPGVSAEWPAARTNDQPQEATQNDGTEQPNAADAGTGEVNPGASGGTEPEAPGRP